MTNTHRDTDVPHFDSERLLERAIDIISTARTIPLSSSPMINRDEIIEILQEALERFPEEVRQARWMLKERAEFLAKTRREADDIVDASRAQAERMVQRTEVVRQAEHRARLILESADAEARRMRREVEDFCDQRLASFEIVLDKVAKTVTAGRERLNASAEPRDEAPAKEATADDGSAFFDQDLD
jgi:cell division septum initiation protein DivIVA